MTSIRRLGWTAFALFALVGCEPAAPTPAPGTPPPSPSAEPPKASTEPKKEAAAVKLSDEEIAEIKKLPADEQPIALAQLTCPVTDEHLGGDMGPPVKEVIEGKAVYVCCASCLPKLKADPATYLAKLKK